jgi:hypothetical protein
MALIFQAVRTSETSFYFNESTRLYITEGCHLHTRRHENLQSHICKLFREMNVRDVQLKNVTGKCLVYKSFCVMLNAAEQLQNVDQVAVVITL